VRDDVSDRPLAGLLDELAEPDPGPAGGTAAAAAAGMAAALVAMVARASASEWPEAGGVSAQALVLCDRAVDLAHGDAAAFTAAITRVRAAAQGEPDSDGRLREALEESADVPLLIAEVAADVAELAALAARHGIADLRPDALVAARLAAAAAAGGSHLVEVNLGVTAGAPVLEHARRASEDAARALADASRAP
jgi:formiminotetrahydrofolate cyclodeaminase